VAVALGPWLAGVVVGVGVVTAVVAPLVRIVTHRGWDIQVRDGEGLRWRRQAATFAEAKTLAEHT
jgi:hypothetical protein